MMNKHFTVVSVVVYHPKKELPRRIAKLVSRLIQNGMEEAANSDPEDFVDRDTKLAQSLEFGVSVPVIGGCDG